MPKRVAAVGYVLALLIGCNSEASGNSSAVDAERYQITLRCAAAAQMFSHRVRDGLRGDRSGPAENGAILLIEIAGTQLGIAIEAGRAAGKSPDDVLREFQSVFGELQRNDRNITFRRVQSLCSWLPIDRLPPNLEWAN